MLDDTWIQHHVKYNLCPLRLFNGTSIWTNLTVVDNIEPLLNDEEMPQYILANVLLNLLFMVFTVLFFMHRKTEFVAPPW
jgi:hypothetical protein